MIRNILIGLVVVGVGMVIAGVTLGPPGFITLGIVVVVAGWGVYLAWMVRKKKASLFHNQLEPGSAERRYKILKAFLLVAGISLAVGIVGVILHNALSALLEREESIFFFIGLVGLFVFAIATIGSFVVYITGRRKPT
jgi:hypothetical protein